MLTLHSGNRVKDRWTQSHLFSLVNFSSFDRWLVRFSWMKTPLNSLSSLFNYAFFAYRMLFLEFSIDHSHDDCIWDLALAASLRIILISCTCRVTPKIAATSLSSLHRGKLNRRKLWQAVLIFILKKQISYSIYKMSHIIYILYIILDI